MLVMDETLKDIGSVRHGFFTREGGVSTGIYASLNCGLGSADAPDDIATNRARAIAWLGIANGTLATVNQVHGTTVVVIDGKPPETPPNADALVTRTLDVALGILTADCAPVLFADPKAGVIGAAHAGWRGALAGVLEETMAAMEKLGARRDRAIAAVGPCIAQASYQVGPEFPAPFVADDPDNDRFFVADGDDGKFGFDLEGYVVKRLTTLGLAGVSALATDTCPRNAPFFSYRRSVLAGEPDYGRCLSAIALTG